MNNPEMMPANGKASFNLSMRDLLAMGLRRKHTVLLCFFGVLLGTVLFVVFAPPRYTATAKFLVEKERMDPIVTAEQTSPVMMRNPVTEEDINSEIEVIKSDDVLRQVVLGCGLNNRKSLSEYILGPATPEKRIAKAAERLSGMLDIQPVKKSDIITVSYTSDNPQLAAHVLQVLGDAYLQKHSVVHTPPGQEKFFDSEAQRYKKNLADVEAQIKEFSKQDNGVGPSVARPFPAKASRVPRKLAADPRATGCHRGTNQDVSEASRNHARAVDHGSERSRRCPGSARVEETSYATGNQSYPVAYQVSADVSAGAGSRQANR